MGLKDRTFILLLISLCFTIVCKSQSVCDNLTIDTGYPKIVNPICGLDNGSIEVVASGNGTVYYSIDGSFFSENNFFDNLAEGFYTIYYQDDICGPKAVEVQLEGSTPIVLSAATVRPTSCDGSRLGSITVNATGRGLKYQINGNTPTLSNTFTDLSAGIYVITVIDSNNCQKQQIVTVPSGSIIFNPSEDISKSRSNCNSFDGYIHLTAQSTTGASLRYRLTGEGYTATNTSGNFNNLAPGLYTAEIIDGRCVVTQRIRISGFIPHQIENIQKAECDEDTGSFDININNPELYEYSIDNGNTWQSLPFFENLAPGTYTLQIRRIDNDCIDNRSRVNIEVNQQIESPKVRVNQASCTSIDGSIQASATSTGTLTYTLYDENHFELEANSTGLFDELPAGQYYVGFTDTNDCEAERLGALIEIDNDITSISEPQIDASDCRSDSGIITITAQARSGIAEYILDDGESNTTGVFENVSGGVHTIEVISNIGCSKTIEVYVNEFNDINVLIIHPDSPDYRCSGNGTLYIKAEGTGVEFSLTGNEDDYHPGNEDGEYRFTDLDAGHYIIYMRNALGCYKTAEAELTASFTVYESIVTPSNCFKPNGVIEVNAFGEALVYSINGGPFQESPRFENLAIGTYEITIIDDKQCVLTTTAEVTNIGNVEITDYEVTSTFCGEPNGQLQFTATSDVPQLEYSVDGQRYQNSSSFSNLPAGTQQIYARDKVYACTDTVTIDVPESSIPKLKIVTKPAICQYDNGEVTIYHDGGIGRLNYSLNGSPYRALNQFFDLTDGDYELTVIDEVGCMVTDSLTIERACKALYANTIAPNNNNVSERLIIIYYKPVEIIDYRIYNAWGELIYKASNFSSEDKEHFWDGGNQQSGPYLLYSKHVVEGVEEEFSGTVHLIR